MVNEKKPKAPLSLRRAKAEEELIGCVNDISARYDIPFFMLADILFRISAEAREGAQKELNAAVNSYNVLLTEYEKNCAENEKKKAEGGDLNG